MINFVAQMKTWLTVVTYGLESKDLVTHIHKYASTISEFANDNFRYFRIPVERLFRPYVYLSKKCKLLNRFLWIFV
jgi:hypothetical protein